jgi:hypothetical protein
VHLARSGAAGNAKQQAVDAARPGDKVQLLQSRSDNFLGAHNQSHLDNADLVSGDATEAAEARHCW